MPGAAEDILAKIAGDSFRAVAPEEDLLLAIDNIEASWKALKNGPEDFGIAEFGHDTFPARGKRATTQ